MMCVFLTGNKRAKLNDAESDDESDDDSNDDEADVALPDVYVKHSTQNFYDQHKNEVGFNY